MAIVRSAYLKKSANEPPPLPVRRETDEDRMEQERMQDVLILIENLIEREEITIRLIMDCLYDVGSKNLINQKVQFGLLNWLMKRIAILTKPVFKIFAMRWFKKNCPRIITAWLHSKVSFPTVK